MHRLDHSETQRVYRPCTQTSMLSFCSNTTEGRRVNEGAPAVYRLVTVCWFNHPPRCSARPSASALPTYPRMVRDYTATWADRCIRPAALFVTTQLTAAHDQNGRRPTNITPQENTEYPRRYYYQTRPTHW